MRLHQRLFVLGLCLWALFVLSSAVQAGFFPPGQKFYTIKTDHFVIHFPKELSATAEELRGVAEESYTHITSRLGYKPWGRTHVVLTDKSSQANGLATVVPYNYILLFAARPTADSSLDHYRDYLRLLFNHEFTHIVHIDRHSRWSGLLRFIFGQVVAPNGASPAWMREGMAVYEESMLDKRFGRMHSAHTDMVLRTAYLQNKFPRIDQIAGLSHNFPAGDGPYLFGAKFFEWLAQKYGEERMYKYQEEYGATVFIGTLNNKARRVYGKSFYKLWREFQDDLFEKFEGQKTRLEAQGLTEFEDVVKNQNSQNYYTVAPSGTGVAYFNKSFDSDSHIKLDFEIPQEVYDEVFEGQDPKDIDLPKNVNKALFGQMTFSKTGRFVVFGTSTTIEQKKSLSEVYYYDLYKAKLGRIKDDAHKKKAMNVRDPDFSSKDGGERWLVMVKVLEDRDELMIFDTDEHQGYIVTNSEPKTQFSNPRFSPDGSKIVVSRKDAKGFRDVVVYSNKGKFLYRVTHDIMSDGHPMFSRDGRKIYFDSYRTGISNIFSYDLETRTITQLTNVLDGVFQPVPSVGGDEIYVQRYSSGKKYIQKFPLYHRYTSLTSQEPLHFRETQGPVFADNSLQPHGSLRRDHKPLQQFSQSPWGWNHYEDEQDDVAQESEEQPEQELDKPEEKTVFPSAYKDALKQLPAYEAPEPKLPDDAKPYRPFPQTLVPRYLAPSFLYFENTFLIGAAIGRVDPLYRHAWTAFVNYRTDAEFTGFGGTYSYNRYNPRFYVGGLRYAVDRGDVTLSGTTTTVRFFEKRWRAYVGTSFAIKRHNFNVAYFYEDRSALTNLTAAFNNMVPYAGTQLRYSFNTAKRYANSISYEKGFRIKLGFDFTDTVLGADAANEERAVFGDFRYYIEMPWLDHHVLALRAAAGWTWGAQQDFGAFRLGGPFGEGVGAGYSSRVFPLRGLPGITFGADKVVLFSAEYRLPLSTKVNRGIGTLPFFLNKTHLSFFVDAGDARYRTSTSDLFDQPLVSVGAEILGDFVIGYGLPITWRLGYGIVVFNNDRISSLTDSVTKQSLKYGSVYFQVGTMF